MTRRVVFEEPDAPRTTALAPTEPEVNWFLQSTRPDAFAGRRLVNNLYTQFPDVDGKFRAKLRSTTDTDLLTALDELLVYDWLSRNYRVAYEEGDEGSRPDFRLYNRSGYVGAVEVVSLFLREEWASETRRHHALAKELNNRLTVTTHSVDFEIRRWDSQPSVRRLANWLERSVRDLGEDPDTAPLGDMGVPEKIYRTGPAELVFYFFPFPAGQVPEPTDQMVLSDAAFGGLVNSSIRLRDKLDGKARKYDLRGKPYAIAVGVHDPMCDLDDVHEALVGTRKVIVATGQGVRGGDGFYGGRSPAFPGGKHRQVSCVYAIQDWWPAGPYRPRFSRFDNPFAEAAFPSDCLPIDAYWAVMDRGPTRINCGWLVPPRPRRVNARLPSTPQQSQSRQGSGQGAAKEDS